MLLGREATNKQTNLHCKQQHKELFITPVDCFQQLYTLLHVYPLYCSYPLPPRSFPLFFLPTSSSFNFVLFLLFLRLRFFFFYNFIFVFFGIELVERPDVFCLGAFPEKEIPQPEACGEPITAPRLQGARWLHPPATNQRA